MQKEIKISHELLNKCHSCFCAYLADERGLYKPMTLEKFENVFIAEENDLKKYFIADEKTGAFIAGLHDNRNNKNFLTFILVPLKFRRQGIAKNLLKQYKEILAKETYENQTIEISFFNPINLVWIIPESSGHEHPNAPGIDMASVAYLFFQNQGFRNFSYQNSYYLDLNSYTTSEKLVSQTERLEREGIRFQIYDKRTMKGFKELLDDLNSEVWTRELSEEISENGLNRPIIVPVFQDTVYGFAGPVSVEESGRGFLSGLGVHSAMRGKGVATVLFNNLCSALKAEGASYMTLFTGESNPARNIYEASGFKVVRTWADMRKERK